MFPLYSNQKVSRIPFVTVLLIIANIVVFWFQLTGPGSIIQSVRQYGMIPFDLFHPGAIDVPGRIAAPVTFFTCMFMHGGFLHLGGNMLYLWVFGRNVEDYFGHLRFLVFYLATGVLAAIVFMLVFPTGTAPLVGASGAIAGIQGGFFLRFPRSKIYCLIFIIIIVRIIKIPAFFVLGFWFVYQIGASMASVTSPAGAAGHGGVAWIAHVAGFVVGIIWAIWEMRRQHLLRRRSE